MNTNRVVGALALVSTAACAEPRTADAPVPPRRAAAEYVTYDVQGSTPGELFTAMRRDGPRAPGEAPSYGRTEWMVTWRARWAGSGPCRVQNVDVQLRTRIILPRWVQPPDAPAGLVERWNAFMAALSEHEVGHADIAASAARQVRREVERVTSPTCAGMEPLTQAAAERVLEEHRRRNLEYDRRTRHGLTQGAVWPPRDAASP
jgi:predicted secreted Zn-dependent protease